MKKTEIIKEWNGLEPGIHDLPETMVARLKKHGYAKDPDPPKPVVKKVLIEPKPKKKTKIQKDAYTKDI